VKLPKLILRLNEKGLGEAYLDDLPIHPFTRRISLHTAAGDLSTAQIDLTVGEMEIEINGVEVDLDVLALFAQEQRKT
jgi:hypothetical protein